MDNHNVGAQHAAPLRVSPARDHALDALRALAVIGMMAAHTARLMPRDVRPDWATGVLLIEPVIPSLFLFLVGLSLARSFTATRARNLEPGAWFTGQLKRAGALWLITVLFFILELGARLPDAFVAGGILATIAYAILLVGGLLALGRGAAPLIAALVVGTGLFVFLDLRDVRIHPLNIGNSPFIPLWLFALMGAVWGLWFGPQGQDSSRGAEGTGRAAFLRRPRGNRALAPGLLAGILAGGIALALIARYGLEPLFTKPLGRSDAGRLVPAALFALPGVTRDAIHIGYYNLRPVLAAACLGLHLAALTGLGLALAGMREQMASWIFALGRRALMAYVLHLALLAALVTVAGERQPLKSGTHGTLVWLGLIVLCHLASKLTPKLRRRNNNVHFGH